MRKAQTHYSCNKEERSKRSCSYTCALVRHAHKRRTYAPRSDSEYFIPVHGTYPAVCLGSRVTVTRALVGVGAGGSSSSSSLLASAACAASRLPSRELIPQAWASTLAVARGHTDSATDLSTGATPGSPTSTRWNMRLLCVVRTASAPCLMDLGAILVRRLNQ